MCVIRWPPVNEPKPTIIRPSSWIYFVVIHRMWAAPGGLPLKVNLRILNEASGGHFLNLTIDVSRLITTSELDMERHLSYSMTR